MATKTFTAKTKGQWVQLSTLSNFDFVDGKDYTLQVLGTAKFGDDGKTGILIDSTTPYTYTHKSGVDLYVMTENEDGAVITVSDSASLALATRGGGSGGGSGDAVWGSITGTLSDQTDLQTALNAKQDLIDSTHKLSASLVDGLATVATTGAYSDLSGTPDLSTYVTTDTAQNITATKTFTHSSQNIVIKGGTASGTKYGISYYKGDTEKAFLQYRNNDINSKDFLCIGNFSEESYLGFRNSGTTSARYNLLCPLGSDAKTPFSLTGTSKDFYLPLGVTDGTTMVTTSSSGVLDISPLLSGGSVSFNGATGSFTSQDGKTVTVTNGVITSIV